MIRSQARIPWVRSFGALAELVAPRAWRDELHANLEAAATRYRPIGPTGPEEPSG